MPSSTTATAEDYERLSAKLKLLAHAERLRILDVLRREPECVCHLEATLGKPQPYISQQLRLLRDAQLLRDEKVGQNVFYRLVDEDVQQWLALVLGPVDVNAPVAERHVRVPGCVCPKCEAKSAVQATA